MTQNVFIAGGPSSFVSGNLSRKLEEHGFKVGWHVSEMDGGSSWNGLPKGCEVVLILKDMIGHTLEGQVMAAAKKAEVPAARIPRKWSLAQAALRVVGILPAVANGDAPTTNWEDIKTVAYDYMLQQRRNGRVPKEAEVQSAIRLAFGKRVQLAKDTYQKLNSQAAREVPVNKPDVEKMKREIREWVILIIEEHPDLLLRPTDIIQRVTRHTKFPDTIVRPTMPAIIEDIKARFVSADTGDREWRDSVMRTWMHNWFIRFRDTGKDWPKHKLVMDQSKRVFGVCIRWTEAKAVRAQVLGEWATDLIGRKSATKYAYQKYEKEIDVTALMEADKIKHVLAGDRRLTSEVAIDQYMATLEETPAEIEPVTETPEIQAPQSEAADLTTLMATLEEDLLAKVAGLIRPFEQRLEAVQKQMGDLQEAVRKGREGREEVTRRLDSIGKSLGQIHGRLSAKPGQSKADPAKQQERQAFREFVQQVVESLPRRHEAIERRLDNPLSERAQSLATFMSDPQFRVNIQISSREDEPTGS